jgi:hypothetical protein
MYVKIGSPLQFSYTVGGEMFTFPILNQVNSVLWKKKSVVFDVSFVNHSTMTITIKENALQGDHYVGSITTDTTLDSLFKEEKGNRIPLYSIIHLSEDDKEKRKVLRLNFNNLESFKQMKEGNASAKDMMKNILRYGGMVKYYIDDNSFLEMETKYVDDYLRQESIQWKGVKDFADDEYIEIVLEIDGSTNATDNYTGIKRI